MPLLKLHQEEEKRIIKTMKENIIEIMHMKHIKNTKKEEEDQKRYNFIRRKLIKKPVLQMWKSRSL